MPAIFGVSSALRRPGPIDELTMLRAKDGEQRAVGD
jgi:hypothetical protein